MTNPKPKGTPEQIDAALRRNRVWSGESSDANIIITELDQILTNQMRDAWEAKSYEAYAYLDRLRNELKLRPNLTKTLWRLAAGLDG